jgi:uncharacterized membrane protein YfcA
MQIYLPIAELSVNVLFIMGMGAAIGFLSGMFGVGGGFLLTPLLIFTGIPSAVAVSTGANPLIATSITGTVAQWRRGNVDLKLGWFLLAGSAVGALLGVLAIRALREAGQVDLFVSLFYVVFLGGIGIIMLIESLRTLNKLRHGRPASMRRSGQHSWIHGLPFKTRFPTSKLYISAIPALVLGLIVGFLSGVMGVGGGFLVVPAMIYLLRVPTTVAIGTSLFQVIFVSAMTTVLHAVFNQTVDVMLSLLLMIGGVVGAHAGTLAGQNLKGEQLRMLLALLVLSVAVRLGFDLVTPPGDPFNYGGTQI